MSSTDRPCRGTQIEVFYKSNDPTEPWELAGQLDYRVKWCGLISVYPVHLTRKVPTVPFYHLDIYAANDKTITVYVKDKDLNVINLAGARAVFTVRKTKDSPTVLIQKDTANPSEGEIGSPNWGEIFFYIVPADTSGLDQQEEYVFDVRVQVASGKVYTVLEGIMLLREPVNLTTP